MGSVHPVLERGPAQHCAVDAQVADVGTRAFNDERQVAHGIEGEAVADMQDFEVGLPQQFGKISVKSLCGSTAAAQSRLAKQGGNGQHDN